MVALAVGAAVLVAAEGKWIIEMRKDVFEVPGEAVAVVVVENYLYQTEDLRNLQQYENSAALEALGSKVGAGLSSFHHLSLDHKNQTGLDGLFALFFLVSADVPSPQIHVMLPSPRQKVLRLKRNYYFLVFIIRT